MPSDARAIVERLVERLERYSNWYRNVLQMTSQMSKQNIEVRDMQADAHVQLEIDAAALAAAEQWLAETKGEESGNG